VVDPETKEESKKWRQSFSASKEVQYTEVIKQGVAVCLLGQRRNFACRLPEKVCNHHGKVPRCNSQQLKQQLVSKRRENLSSGIWFLQETVVSHKAAIAYQELADLYFEVLKHPDLAPSDSTFF
jgi:hypothetical protein